MATNLRTLSLLTENTDGALQRVVSMIRRRGFTIDSLTMGAATDPSMLTMTVTVDVGKQAPDQARKQVAKVIDVIAVEDVTADDTVEHELALVRVAADATRHHEAEDFAKTHGAHVVDRQPRSVVISISGPRVTVESFLTAAESYGVIETRRTSAVAMRTRDDRMHVMDVSTTETPIEGAA